MRRTSVARAAALFRATLRAPGVRIIAECKRRSPSRGVLRRDYDAVAIARWYAAGGAAALSVLTEPTFFDGTLDHLRAVREAVDLPILRKDFIVTEFQIAEARAAGADAVLLIVAALGDPELEHLIVYARQLDLAALVEVHDAEELRRALDAGADLVGVNSRNLRTLEVSGAVFTALAGQLPPGVTAVAESGLKSADDLRRLHDAAVRRLSHRRALHDGARSRSGARRAPRLGRARAEPAVIVRVKICGLTRREDAALAVRHGASAVGLVFWSKTQLEPSR